MTKGREKTGIWQEVSSGLGGELWLHEDASKKTDISDEALPRSKKQEQSSLSAAFLLLHV